MTLKPAWFYQQSGVIPTRENRGSLEVLLISNRKGTRWVIPKGVVEPGLDAAESASKEAWEEAGIRGTLSSLPLGAYRYPKWSGTCTVEVYRMDVFHVARTWPEAKDRKRQWLPPEDASLLVQEAELRAMILELGRAAIRGVPQGESP